MTAGAMKDIMNQAQGVSGSLKIADYIALPHEIVYSWVWGGIDILKDCFTQNPKIKGVITSNTSRKLAADIMNSLTAGGIISMHESVRIAKKKLKAKMKEKWFSDQHELSSAQLTF
jgi:hypothetical protein